MQHSLNITPKYGVFNFENMRTASIVDLIDDIAIKINKT